MKTCYAGAGKEKKIDMTAFYSRSDWQLDNSMGALPFPFPSLCAFEINVHVTPLAERFAWANALLTAVVQGGLSELPGVLQDGVCAAVQLWPRAAAEIMGGLDKQ